MNAPTPEGELLPEPEENPAPATPNVVQPAQDKDYTAQLLDNVLVGVRAVLEEMANDRKQRLAWLRELGSIVATFEESDIRALGQGLGWRLTPGGAE